jgi:urea ABC transporter ATP-binding protein UrtE
LLEVEQLRGGYGATSVLFGVDLVVHNGEIVALLGRNGVGKSTLLRTVIGLLPATGGQIRLDGKEITRLPAHARTGFGYVPQDRQIFPRLSVRDNLRVAAMARGLEPDPLLERTIAEFPILAPKLDTRGGSLSGGQQQILALARALIGQPRVLLLDEPTEGIQPSIVDMVGEKIQEINRRYDVSILLIEQNLEFATELASRAYIMRKGRIAEELESARILSSKELQREYLGV